MRQPQLVSGGRSNHSEIMTNEIENTEVLIYDVDGRVVKTLQWVGKFSDSDLESLNLRITTFQREFILFLCAKERIEKHTNFSSNSHAGPRIQSILIHGL